MKKHIIAVTLILASTSVQANPIVEKMMMKLMASQFCSVYNKAMTIQSGKKTGSLREMRVKIYERHLAQAGQLEREIVLDYGQGVVDKAAVRANTICHFPYLEYQSRDKK